METGKCDQTSPEPASLAQVAKPSRVRQTPFANIEKGALYIALYGVLVALFVGLWLLTKQSADLYGKGVGIALDGYFHRHADPSPMTRRIFLLVSSHEVVTFKMAALAIASVIVVTGALLVLKGVEAAYHVTGESGFWKGTLQTSSPGLVMITFGCALVAWTLSSKSSVADPSDPGWPVVQSDKGPEPPRAGQPPRETPPPDGRTDPPNPVPSASGKGTEGRTPPTTPSTSSTIVLVHHDPIKCNQQRELMKKRKERVDGSSYYERNPRSVDIDKNTEKELCAE